MKYCTATYCPYMKNETTTATGRRCHNSERCIWYENALESVYSTTPVQKYPYTITYELQEPYIDPALSFDGCRNCAWYKGICLNLESPFASELMNENETCKKFERKKS